MHHHVCDTNLYDKAIIGMALWAILKHKWPACLVKLFSHMTIVCQATALLWSYHSFTKFKLQNSWKKPNLNFRIIAYKITSFVHNTTLRTSNTEVLIIFYYSSTETRWIKLRVQNDIYLLYKYLSPLVGKHLVFIYHALLMAKLRHNHQGTEHGKLALYAKWLKVLPFNYNHY